MQFQTLALFLAAGLTAAQTTTATAPGASSSCAAQMIVEACLGSTTPQFDACPPTDYSCQCTQIQNMLTCYNNCPGDADQFGMQQKKIALCNAASAYPTTGTATMSKVASATAPLVNAGAPGTTGLPTGMPTVTAAAPAKETPGAAGHVVAPLGLVGAVVGALAFL